MGSMHVVALLHVVRSAPPRLVPSAVARLTSLPRLGIAVLLAALLASCSASTSTPTAGPTTAGGSPVAATPSQIPGCEAVVSHQAPALEALLPASVSGRTLTRWSLGGPCWLRLAIGSPADVDAFLAQLQGPNAASKVDVNNLAYGVSGRSDTRTDPPYFVYGATRPNDELEIQLAAYLLFGSAGFHDPVGASELSRYTVQTVGEKQVWVGTLDMLDQGDHQRGSPYLYQTDTAIFLVITDDEPWAADAIRQLP
jgi:hypothetical protein